MSSEASAGFKVTGAFRSDPFEMTPPSGRTVELTGVYGLFFFLL